MAVEKQFPITIRKATTEDVQHILDCLREAFEPYRTSYTPEAFRDTVLTEETLLKRFDEMTILVATDEAGKVVGTVAGKLASKDEGHLRGMAVLPGFQGRGVAGQLLAAIESHLFNQGCVRITLGTTEPLKRAARFYERNGYRLSSKVTDFFGMPLYEYIKEIESLSGKHGCDEIPPLPGIWPPVAIAVILPLAWIYYSEASQLKWFGILHFLYLPVYVVLVFGLMWPISVALQLRTIPFSLWIRLRRAWASITIFVICGGLSVPFIRVEYQNYARTRNTKRVSELQRLEGQKDQFQAWQAIRSRGVTAFSEPLTQPQRTALLRYIGETVLTPAEARLASEHYRMDIPVMTALAAKKEMPAGALTTLYENALKSRTRPELGAASDIFDKIGTNPNASVALLIQMVESDDPEVRLSASESPRLPKAAKIAYLKRAFSSPSPAERRRVASDPDTPAEVLGQVAIDPATEGGLAKNPHTPVSVLQRLAESHDQWVRTWAVENLRNQAHSDR